MTGVRDVVTNHTWLDAQTEVVLEDGSVWGVCPAYPLEEQVLETVGGAVQIMSLLHAGEGHSVLIAVGGDVLCDYGYVLLHDRAPTMAAQAVPSMHLAMVPNPSYHLRGDLALDSEGMLHVDGIEWLTFGNIGLYDTCLFASVAPGAQLMIIPLYHWTIAEGRVTGEYLGGRQENVETPAQPTALDVELVACQAFTPSRRITIPPSSGGPTGSPAASNNRIV